MKLLLLGPPGAGKGTQGARLSGLLGLPHIDAGDIVRGHVERGDRLGTLALPFVKSRRLLPPDLMIEIMEPHLKTRNAHGYIMDGFPRQPESKQWLSGQCFRPDLVLALTVDHDEIRRRLAHRKRSEDDAGDGLQRRLDEFELFTARIIDEYHRDGIASSVDARGGFDETTGRLLAAIGENSLMS